MAQFSSIMGIPKSASPGRAGGGKEEDHHKDHVASCDRPWSSQVVVMREETAVTGTYGIGMGVDVPVGKTKVEKPFAVSKVTSLKDPMGNDANSTVGIGDILCFCNDRSVAKEGESIIESTIWGEPDSLLKLTFKNSRTGQMYDRTVKRHVPIPGRTHEYTRKWYDVSEHLEGKELATSGEMVRLLNSCRSTVIDPQGREMDFLAGIKKRGSHVGLTLSHGGLVVDKVTPGSPAALAGVQQGDVVRSVDGATEAGRVAGLLVGHERIGSPCKVVLEQQGGGGRREVTLVRTQISALNRIEELLTFVATSDLLKDAPAARDAVKAKIIELEKERQYEERVMAGRMNKSHSELLAHLADAAETLRPPPPDLSTTLAELRQYNADLATTNVVLEKEVAQQKERLERELNLAADRAADLLKAKERLEEELSRLRAELMDSVPKAQLNSANQALSAAQEERDALRVQVAGMMSREEHDRAAHTLKTITSQLQADLRAAQAALKQAEEKSKGLEEEAAALRAQVAQANADKAAADKDAQAARAEAKKSKDALAGAKAEAEGLKRQLSAAQEEVAVLRPRAEAEAKNRAGLEGERFGLEEQLKAAKRAEKEAEDAAAKARRDVKAAREEGDKLASERDAAKRKAANVEAAAKEAEEAQAGVKKRLKAAEDLAHALQTKLQAAERKIKEAQDEEADAKAKAKAAREAEAVARAALEGAQGQGQRSKQDKAALEEHASRLQAELQEARAEALSLTEQLDKAKRQAKEAEDKVKERQKEVEGMKAEMARLKQAALDAESKAETALKRLKTTEGVLASTKAELSKAQADGEEARKEAAALAGDLKSARAAAATASEEAKKAAADAAQAKKKAQEAQAALKDAQDKFAAAEERLEKEGHAEQQRLRLQLEERAARLEEEAERNRADLKRARAAQAAAEEEKEGAERAAKKAAQSAAEEKKAVDRKSLQREEALKKLLADTEAKAKKAAEDAKKAADDAEKARKLAEEQKELARAAEKARDAAKAAEAEAITAAAFNGGEVQRFKNDGDKARKEVAALELKVAEAEKEVERNRALARRLLAPDFATEGGGFTGEVAVTLTAKPGTTVYVNLSDSKKPFSTADADAKGPAPLEVTVSESCVVRAAAYLEDEELLSDVAEQEFTKKRQVKAPGPAVARAAPPPPPVAPVICGVGMLLHRERKGGEVTVGDIYEGGEVERDGRIRVGDVLLGVGGVPVEGLSMDEVSDGICGLPGTEVTLQLERKGGEEGNPKPGAAAFTDSLHSLSGGAGGQFEVVLQRREEQVGVGMMVSRMEDKDLRGAIIVQELFPGGAAAAEGSIEVGDVLLSVNGTPVDKLDMGQVSDLIVGVHGSEVEMVLERKESRALSEAEQISQGCYRVKLNRQRRETVFKRDSTGLSVLDSGKSLLGSLDFFQAPPQAT